MRPGTKFVMLLAGSVIIWGGIFFVVGCGNNPKEKAKAVAEKSLLACVDRPESVKIKAVSQPDSVFGRDYLSQDEQSNIAMAMLQISRKVMEETDNMESIDFEDKAVTELMERQMSAATILRNLDRFGDSDGKEKKPFNGWKVKIEYEALSESGKPYRSEYWFFLDKDATCVVNSFEIPLL